MAYARRKYGQRKMYKRRRYVPKNTKVVARKAFNMVRAMRRTYKPELKKYDMGQSSYACGTTAGFIGVTGIAQGDNYNNREGNKILVRYVNAKGWIKHNNTATDGQVVKVWLIQDKQQVGDTTPTAAQLFTVAANSVTSPINPTTCGRFKILWSKTYILDPSNEIKPFYLNKKMYLPVRYNGTTGDDIQKNGLYIVYASSDNTNSPNLTIDIRTSYNDN